MTTTDNPPGMNNLQCVGTKPQSPGLHDAEAARARGVTQQPPLQPWASHSVSAAPGPPDRTSAMAREGGAARSAKRGHEQAELYTRWSQVTLLSGSRNIHEGRCYPGCCADLHKSKARTSGRIFSDLHGLQ